MSQSEKLKWSTEVLVSGGISQLDGFSSATTGSEHPLGKVQMQNL